MSNPYATMLDTAQARIAALEAEKAVLTTKLRELCDAVETRLTLIDGRSIASRNLKDAVAAAREVFNG